MQFPETKATELTEKIMSFFSGIGNEKYNPIFEHVYKVLSKEFPEPTRPEPTNTSHQQGKS